MQFLPAGHQEIARTQEGYPSIEGESDPADRADYFHGRHVELADDLVELPKITVRQVLHDVDPHRREDHDRSHDVEDLGRRYERKIHPERHTHLLLHDTALGDRDDTDDDSERPRDDGRRIDEQADPPGFPGDDTRGP